MTRTFRCLIVDDEPLALDLLENFLTRLDITAITRCENGVDAFHLLQQQSFDLLFLDIQMPRISGLDLLKSLTHKPAVIITTAYRDYAVEGFELEVVDYLVKPFAFPRFMQTIEKARRLRLPDQPAASPPPTATSIPLNQTITKTIDQTSPEPTIGDPTTAPQDAIILKADRQLIRVPINDILFIESKKDYIRVYTTNGEWLCHQSLTDITASLPPEKFFRTHRSFTIALDKIDILRQDHVLIRNRTIPVSRELRKTLRLLLAR